MKQKSKGREARINFSFVFIFFVSSPKGSYLSACLHYLALFGSTNTSATVIGNNEHGGLNKEDALLIQVCSENLRENLLLSNFRHVPIMIQSNFFTLIFLL